MAERFGDKRVGFVPVGSRTTIFRSMITSLVTIQTPFLLLKEKLAIPHNVLIYVRICVIFI